MRRLLFSFWPFGFKAACVWLLALMGPALWQPAAAQSRSETLTAAERQQLQQQLDAQNRRAPLLAAEPALQWLPPVAAEAPCFLIYRFELLGNPGPGPLGFDWLLADLGAYSNTCLGAASLEQLQRNLDSRLLARGYATSHVSVPAQNLNEGVLKLQLHLGRLARVEARTAPGADPSERTRTLSRHALALQPGDVLNLRSVEQTLENLARLPSHAVQFQIEAAEQPGFSVLAMTPSAPPGSAQARSWRLGVGLDNAAARDYGRWQSHLQATVDSPLGLADQLFVSHSRSLDNNGSTRQQASSLLSYTVPWGHHALLLNATTHMHDRPIQGLSTRFSENGFERSVQARWQWTAWRSASSRLQLWGGSTQRRARNHVDDVELVLQRRRTNTWDWGFNSWTRWAAGEWSVDYEQTVSTRLPAETDFQLDAPALVRTRRLQLEWQQGFAVGEGLAAQFAVRLAWAGVRRPASGADLQSLGSRWSVRGFDAQGFISGQEQITLKQDLRGPVWALASGPRLQPYAALDYGRVAAATPGAGRVLVGAAAGLRLQGAGFAGLSGWTADLAMARPLHRPDGFAPAKAVLYSSFNVSY